MSRTRLSRRLGRLLTHWHPRSDVGIRLHNALFRLIGFALMNWLWQWLLVRWGRALGWVRPNNFLLLGTARAGTTLAVDYLNCHRGVHCHGEILGESAFWYGNPWRKKYERLALHVEALFVKRPGLMTGAKILTFHLDELPIKMFDLVELLHRPKVIALYREQLLEQFVSLKIAERDRFWHVKKEVRPEPIRIDAREFVAFAQRERRMWQENLAALERCQIHYVTYEHLISDTEQAMGELFAFLGLEPCEVDSYLVKINTQSLAEKVVNYRDFLRVDVRPYTTLHLPALADTRWSAAA